MLFAIYDVTQTESALRTCQICNSDLYDRMYMYNSAGKRIKMKLFSFNLDNIQYHYHIQS
jgi:hypothetical protein